MALCAGDLVGGRYCLEEVIGSGGMGDVWRARDRVLERQVALKVVYASDPRKTAEHAKAFLREARISAAISHRNVVQILDFGAHEGELPFMVLELLQGETVAHVLGRGDPVPFDWILAVISQTLDGLAAAHDAGVVHRDLKPENIFLVDEREGVFPKILDFGISKIVDGDPRASLSTTGAGRVLGTPAYMSPEQARGERTLGKTTDVYSMGVVMYELISGSMPFYSENPGDLLLKIMSEQAPPLIDVVPDVGKPLSDLVARAMARRAADRFADAREMQEALLAVAAEALGSEAAARLEQRARPPSWRKASSSAGDNAATLLAHSQRRLKGEASTLDLLELSKPNRSKRARALWLSLGALALVAAGAALAVSLTRNDSEPSARFIVVKADAKSSAETQAVDEPARDPNDATEPVHTSQLAPDADAAPRVTPRASSGAGLAARALSRGFREQKQGVVRCVNEHPSDVSSEAKLSVHIALDANGVVTEAEVAPHTLRATAVGRCIEKAVRAMRFAPQGAPISFEVPLTTKRGG